MVEYKRIRRAAGHSQARAGVESGTSEPTIRLFEAGGPRVIQNEVKRAALISYYEKLAREERERAA